ncbi:MAG: dTDP-4-dehydrorhamnose reductase [Bacteroidetes bacterium]|nr:dTDP-4-dehydrorhamnose reductase [Bacteroidota bacterium]
MPHKKVILVTGANGQLGMEFKAIAGNYPGYAFIFVSREDFPIDNFGAVESFFQSTRIDCCINCAAYTAVDQAESDRGNAFYINGAAAGNLARCCHIHDVRFIHFSTDYVFNGRADRPYLETDPTDPVNGYGESKLNGELETIKHNPGAIIIRTSWVYSSFGKNFVKTMLRLMNERESISVVEDQHGCPTYANDLARAVMQIIEQENKPGIYNYCNAGAISWYQFAEAIREISKLNCKVNPIPTSAYPTPAKRPAYSVLDTEKIQHAFKLTIPTWYDSLKKCISLINNPSGSIDG